MAEIIDDDNLGFVKLFRKLEQWEWYTDVPVKTLFVHCLIKARHNEKRWRGLSLKQGQFPTGLSLLAKQTGLSVSQVRTALEKLVLTNEVTRVSTSYGTVITVNNYSTYHDGKGESGKQDDKQIANESQTNRNY